MKYKNYIYSKDELLNLVYKQPIVLRTFAWIWNKCKQFFGVVRTGVVQALNSLIMEGNKNWNTSLGKWQKDYIIIKTIKFSKYEIARGYPSTKYIVDKRYKISFVCRKGKKT